MDRQARGLANPAESNSTPLRVVLTYRVLFHWRTPVFQRLAQTPGIHFVALHGSDFPGTKAVNAKSPSGFEHHELFTIRPPIRFGGEDVAMPICPTLPFALARLRPDVILAEGGSNLFNNLFVYLYALLARVPVVWWTLGELRGRKVTTWTQRAFDSVVHWMERHAGALLGYSSLAIEYFDRHRYPKERQFRAVNCVDTDKTFSDVERARADMSPLRRRLGLDDKIVLLYVGAMTPAKRVEDLIDVYARLRHRYPSIRLLLVGDGVHRSSLEQHARANGAEDAIFVGQVIDGVSAYFLAGDVFVLPGLGGLAISEAMAHGLPILATEADGCELDLIEEGMNGFLLPVGDQSAMEKAIETLVRSPELIREFGTRSRWLIENRYNIHTYMDNVLAAIRYAAARRDVR